jgi:regulator of replication initiation timing
MFISKEEKKYLFDQIKTLSKDMSLAASEITFLKAKLKATEGNILILKQIVEFNKTTPKPKKPKTAAQKAKQAEYMRRYTAKKRAEKLALEQK